MKNSILTLATILLFTSCAKEEFAINKTKQVASGSALTTTSAKLCAQSTLIRPPVDILMLWDNSTSFNVVTPATKASMGNLIASVSENFDYHILSVPLISTNSNTLYEAQLVARDTSSVTGSASSIIRTKEQVASSLYFTPSTSAAEPGVDRAFNIIQQNRANGIFRQNAYTMVVVISNEDDDSCEIDTGFSPCSDSRWKLNMQEKINKLLCLRGYNNPASLNCSTSGIAPLNSTMMRFINISPLTSCSLNGNRDKFPNVRYKTVAKQIYDASYSNGWPTSSDHFDPAIPGAQDSYDLCSISFSNIFDGVNTAIKQTLLKHKYNYWPAASASADIDPDTIRVVRSDGKILTNRTGESSPPNGFAYIGNGSVNTRFAPTAGEPFNGKLIQLFGTDANDYIVYPDCLTVTFDGVKSTYGYVYLESGKASEPSIQVNRSINGGPWTVIPPSSTNGWSYVNHIQYTSALDPNLKVLNLPPGSPSGYFINLNGSYRFQNSTTTTTTIRVDYTSAP